MRVAAATSTGLPCQRIVPVKEDGDHVIMAKDAVEAAPNVYTVLFENERVRLLQARVKPGDSSSMHSHPNYLVYSLGECNVTFTEASGQSVDVELKDGQSMWREAEEHSAKNLGSTDVVALLIELK